MKEEDHPEVGKAGSSESVLPPANGFSFPTRHSDGATSQDDYALTRLP